MGSAALYHLARPGIAFGPFEILNRQLRAMGLPMDHVAGGVHQPVVHLKKRAVVFGLVVAHVKVNLVFVDQRRRVGGKHIFKDGIFSLRGASDY